MSPVGGRRAARPVLRALGRLAAAVVLVASAVLLTSVASAGAHGGPVELRVETVEPGPGSVRVVVRIVYLGDGHGVADAAVTVAGESGGSRLTPVVLTPTGEEGVYEGVVAVPTPGPWSLRATSAEPTASQTFTAEVPAVSSSTTVTTTGPTATATPEPVGATSPSAAVGATSPSAAPAGSGDAEDDTTWIWVAAVGPSVAAVVTAAGVLYAIGRRRSRGDTAG